MTHVPTTLTDADLLSLPASAVFGKCRDRRSPDLAYAQPAQLGVWPVFPVPAQRKRLSLESQAGIPDLSGAGAEPTDQAAQTHRA